MVPGTPLPSLGNAGAGPVSYANFPFSRLRSHRHHACSAQPIAPWQHPLFPFCFSLPAGSCPPPISGDLCLSAFDNGFDFCSFYFHGLLPRFRRGVQQFPPPRAPSFGLGGPGLYTYQADPEVKQAVFIFPLLCRLKRSRPARHVHPRPTTFL